jgi:hypothetical protein
MDPKSLLPLVAVGLLLTPFYEAHAEAPIAFKVLTKFNYPGAKSTLASGINESGEVAGQVELETSVYAGFVRFRDHFSDPINHPGDRNTTRLTDINNTGTVSGYYQEIDFHFHGFLLTGSTFTDIDVGAMDTFIYSVNDAGNTCGYTGNATDNAFVIIDGVVTFFNVPGADYTDATSINNINQCAGFYYNAQDGFSGFLRNSDGTFVFPIRVPDSNSTLIFGINDNGTMVGLAEGQNGDGYGVFVQSLGRIALYNYPGALGSSFWGINNLGQISGETGTGAITKNLILRAMGTLQD